MKSIVSFDKVCLKYGKFTALNEISFELFEGTSVALVGNNGSGKTSIVHVLCNLLGHQGGDLIVFDKKSTRSIFRINQNLESF